jgi:hypothetical protein
MSIMAMASHGRQVLHFLCVVCVGKGFEDEFLDISDLLFSVRSAFLAVRKPTVIICTTPLANDNFHPSVGNFPWYV